MGLCTVCAESVRTVNKRSITAASPIDESTDPEVQKIYA